MSKKSEKYSKQGPKRKGKSVIMVLAGITIILVIAVVVMMLFDQGQKTEPTVVPSDCINTEDFQIEKDETIEPGETSGTGDFGVISDIGWADSQDSQHEEDGHRGDSVSVVDVYLKEINGEIHLIKVLSDGTEIDEGSVDTSDGDQPVVIYTVTFMNYDGAILKIESVRCGRSATPPDSPVREGYTFVGWGGSYSNVTANVTVMAQYQVDDPEVVCHIVKFVDYNGNVLKTQSVEEGQVATAPAAPTREGHNFIGWDKDFSNVTSNLTVTAQYEEIPSNDPTIVISDVAGSVGDEIEVTFTMTNCPELYSMRFSLSFDDEVLTLISTTSGDSMSAFTYQKPSQLKSGCAFMWYANDLTDGNGIVLKLVFRISENAQPGAYQLTLTCDSSNTYGDGDDLMIESKGGRVYVSAE